MGWLTFAKSAQSEFDLPCGLGKASRWNRARAACICSGVCAEVCSHRALPPADSQMSRLRFPAPRRSWLLLLCITFDQHRVQVSLVQECCLKPQLAIVVLLWSVSPEDM